MTLVGYIFFFFNDTATTEIYTLSLHDALPICARCRGPCQTGVLIRAIPRSCRSRGHGATRPAVARASVSEVNAASAASPAGRRSEEHTSELQSRQYLVCRLLLEKKK